MLRMLLMLFLLLPGLAWASAVVCQVTANPGKVSRFDPSSDPSRFVIGATETCHWIVGDAATAAQIDLWNTTPFHYLKVLANATIGGEVQALALAAKDASEQAAVDAALAEQAQRQAAWQSEVETPGVCRYTTPEQIDNKVNQVKTNNQNNINAMSLSAADKNELIAVANRLTEAVRQAVKCDAARAAGG